MAFKTRRADLFLNMRLPTTMYDGAGTNYIVKTNAGVIYVISLNGSQYLGFTKSTDGGCTWTTWTPIVTNGDLVTSAAIWYDRWSGIAADLIHIAYAQTSSDDVHYLNLDPATDTLSTIYTVFAGSSAATGGTLSITRTRGGNLICGGCIDAGAEPFFKKSTNVGVNWSDITTAYEATQDQIILQPDLDSADNQDAFCFFWDASANEISVKRYDDSANAMNETSISGSMTDTIATSSYPHWSCCCDLTNSQVLIAAWSAVDTANADLRVWKVKTGSITETAANAVLNSSDDQGFCSIGIDTATEYWYIFYGGKSDGSETFNTAINIYYKISTDGGATWGDENKITNKTYYSNFIYGCPRFTIPFVLMFGDYTTYGVYPDIALRINADVSSPKATFQLGM